MRLARLLGVAVLLLVLGGISGCTGFSWGPANRMDKQEWEQWQAMHAPRLLWMGYQGSNAHFHFFIARTRGMGEWQFIKIRRDELLIDDERPWSSDFTGPVYHYLVDPDNYERIKSNG